MDWGFLTCTGPSIACHSDADCQEIPDNPCTIDVCNSPGTPASSCSHTPITACIDGDGCCPMGCTALNDVDCGAVCGNGVIEGAEECEGANLDGQTCVSLGFAGGTLSCYPPGHANECKFDVTGCVAPVVFFCAIRTSYPQKLCCSDVSSVQTTTGTGDCKTVHGAGFTGLVTLSGSTNANVEKYNYTGANGFPHKKNICVELATGSLDCIYATTTQCNIVGYTEKIVSLSSNTNAHIGDKTAYSDLVLCCKEN